jgi:hypothetical protein
VTEPHHEPSYYEIALTNRQVVVAFVVLLVCLLSAFFSGVWIGRGSAERNAGEAQVARAAPPAEPTEGRSLEELKFFSDESSPKHKGRKGGEGAAGTDAADAGRSQLPSPPAPSSSQSPQSPQSNTAPRRTAAPEPAAEPVESAPAPSRPAAVPRPAPAAASRRTTAAPRAPDRLASRTASETSSAASSGASSGTGDGDDGSVVRGRRLPDETTARDAAGTGRTGSEPSTPRTAAQPGAGTVVIQVFASADSNEAKKMRDRLSHGGEPAFVSPLTVDGRTMYRVRVGPFANRARAQKEADRVRRSYKLDTWLTE